MTLFRAGTRSQRNDIFWNLGIWHSFCNRVVTPTSLRLGTCMPLRTCAYHPKWCVCIISLSPVKNLNGSTSWASRVPCCWHLWIGTENPVYAALEKISAVLRWKRWLLVAARKKITAASGILLHSHGSHGLKCSSIISIIFFVYPVSNIWRHIIWLVVWNIFFHFIYLMSSQPHWRTHSITFQDDEMVNHQPVMIQFFSSKVDDRPLLRRGNSADLRSEVGTLWISTSAVLDPPDPVEPVLSVNAKHKKLTTSRNHVMLWRSLKIRSFDLRHLRSQFLGPWCPCWLTMVDPLVSPLRRGSAPMPMGSF